MSRSFTTFVAHRLALDSTTSAPDDVMLNDANIASVSGKVYDYGFPDEPRSSFDIESLEREMQDYEDYDGEEGGRDSSNDKSSVRGLKFAPVTNLTKRDHVRQRNDPLIDQFARLVMEHGKLATAQRVYTLPIVQQ